MKPHDDSRIIRHKDPKKSFDDAAPDDYLIEAISQHIERHVGTPDWVFHEIVSDQVHIDIHHVMPTDNRPVHVLVTSGMSGKPMATPEGAEGCEYAELVAFLPPWWPIGEKEFEDERNYWPIRQLKSLARFPHSYGTWLWFGHTLPNGDPPEPYCKDTGFCGIMLSSPMILGGDFAELQLESGRTISFFSLCPLHADEMEYKVKNGAEKLLQKLYKKHVPDIIEPDRPSVCAGPWSRLFKRGG